MKLVIIAVFLWCDFGIDGRQFAPSDGLANPAIDMDGFLDTSREAAAHRKTRRLAEDEFLEMSRQPGTIILDARSREKYDLLHIKGAINLSFPDITIESLALLIPDKSTHVLIYCNNNFENSELAFPSKLPAASLNLSTYVSLYTYGYRNIYELGPLLDPKQSKLSFESSQPACLPSAR
jgi:hypothetical protein